MGTRLEDISSSVRKAYGTDVQPTYRFVQEAIESDPYRWLVDSLKEWYTIEDDTDTNDDVSFNFILRSDDHAWRLALSMVGPFALLVDGDDPERSTVITESTDPDEVRILRMVKAQGFEFMDRETLRMVLDVNYQDGEDEWTVYHAVFVRSQTPPG
jgi:hypothetical protein